MLLSAKEYYLHADGIYRCGGELIDDPGGDLSGCVQLEFVFQVPDNWRENIGKVISWSTSATCALIQCAIG